MEKKIKKIKNNSQSILVSATEFVSDTWKNEKAVEALEKVKTVEDMEEAKKEFFSCLSVESKTQFKTLGIELPTDQVTLTLTLGSFVYDIIVPSIPKPSAPLRVAAYTKYLGDLAHKLMQEEFELTQEELDSVRKVLDDETLWSQVKIEADLSSSLSIPLSQNGIQIFDQVLKASIKLFEEEKEEEKEKEKEEKEKEKIGIVSEPVLDSVPEPVPAKAKRGRKPKT
jgi:hypothetical protein